MQWFSIKTHVPNFDIYYIVRMHSNFTHSGDVKYKGMYYDIGWLYDEEDEEGQWKVTHFCMPDPIEIEQSFHTEEDINQNFQDQINDLESKITSDYIEDGNYDDYDRMYSMFKDEIKNFEQQLIDRESAFNDAQIANAIGLQNVYDKFADIERRQIEIENLLKSDGLADLVKNIPTAKDIRRIVSKGLPVLKKTRKNSI